ncbi:hypothetical protein [Glaciecola sp. 1036]|uniref:hypothetical protein n=1 Tax=Alteromonadaceae TaxID=72275 RepID=UPI003CFE69A0
MTSDERKKVTQQTAADAAFASADENPENSRSKVDPSSANVNSADTLGLIDVIDSIVEVFDAKLNQLDKFRGLVARESRLAFNSFIATLSLLMGALIAGIMGWFLINALAVSLIALYISHPWAISIVLLINVTLCYWFVRKAKQYFALCKMRESRRLLSGQSASETQ